MNKRNVLGARDIANGKTDMDSEFLTELTQGRKGRERRQLSKADLTLMLISGNVGAPSWLCSHPLPPTLETDENASESECGAQ